MFRISAHLQRHPSSGIFYFRIAIPTRLRDTLGKREVKKSLGTGIRSEAVIEAQRLYVQTHDLFRRTEKKMAPKKSKASSADDLLSILDSMPKSPDGSMRKVVLNIGGNEITIERDDPEEEARVATEVGAKLMRLAPAPAVTPIPAAPKGRPKKDNTVSLSKMISLYFGEVKATGSQQPKTIEENTAIFQLLLERTKNPAAETIGLKAATEFKETLLKLPPNRTKGRFSGKTVSEILRMRPNITMSPSSVNKYLRRISALFDWGKRHGHVHENPFTGLSIRATKRPDQQRDRFTLEELQRLFDPANLHRDMRESYQWWLPWLGLYAGARLEELCQLHLEDIRQEGDVWVFDINANGEKKVKTLSSERLVPIHPRLVELGLLDHVEKLKKRGVARLFPELHQRRDGYGQTASKWFGRFRKRLKIEKPFHSLRHTFVDELHQLGADHKKIAALVGHADESMTGGRYSKPFRPDVLMPVVKMLKFVL